MLLYQFPIFLIMRIRLSMPRSRAFDSQWGQKVWWNKHGGMWSIPGLSHCNSNIIKFTKNKVIMKTTLNIMKLVQK